MANRRNVIVPKIKKFLRILQNNKYRVEKVFLYGSYAKGNYHRDSDIDIVVISKDFTGNRFRDSLRLLKLCRGIDLRIEPMPYRPEDFTDADPLVLEVKISGKEIRV